MHLFLSVGVSLLTNCIYLAQLECEIKRKTDMEADGQAVVCFTLNTSQALLENNSNNIIKWSGQICCLLQFLETVDKCSNG